MNISAHRLGEGKVRSEFERPSQPVDTAAFLFRRLRKAVGSAVSTRMGYFDHFGVHFPRNNAGDTVLFDAIETLFDVEYGQQKWRRSHLRHLVSPMDLARINRLARGVLVGGGGLLSSDSNPNSTSGWQWRIGRQELEELQVPLIVFAIGFNQFRGSEAFNPIFQEHLEATVRKSSFFGMRNHGSVDRTRALLSPEFHDKISFQPCMTTVLSEYHPRLRRDLPAIQAGRSVSPRRRLAVNLAFDRAENRFGPNADLYIDRICAGLKAASEAGWVLELAVHAWDDEPAIAHLRRRNIPVIVKRLNLSAPYEVVRYYAGVDAVVGMRGHAQMIPFGCSTPILSLISHDKMRFFLEDIGHPEWGVEVSDSEVGERVIGFATDVMARPEVFQAQISAAKAPLWVATQTNLKTSILAAMSVRDQVAGSRA